MGKLFFISLIVAIILGCGAFYYKNVAEEQERLKDVYKGNIELLIGKMKEVYNDKVETDRTNEELRQAIRDDKGSSFNWSEDISSTLPIRHLKQLHKNRASVR
jgi:hypothetical protein